MALVHVGWQALMLVVICLWVLLLRSLFSFDLQLVTQNGYFLISKGGIIASKRLYFLWVTASLQFVMVVTKSSCVNSLTKDIYNQIRKVQLYCSTYSFCLHSLYLDILHAVSHLNSLMKTLSYSRQRIYIVATVTVIKNH